VKRLSKVSDLAGWQPTGRRRITEVPGDARGPRRVSQIQVHLAAESRWVDFAAWVAAQPQRDRDDDEDDEDRDDEVEGDRCESSSSN